MLKKLTGHWRPCRGQVNNVVFPSNKALTVRPLGVCPRTAAQTPPGGAEQGVGFCPVLSQPLATSSATTKMSGRAWSVQAFRRRHETVNSRQNPVRAREGVWGAFWVKVPGQSLPVYLSRGAHTGAVFPPWGDRGSASGLHPPPPTRGRAIAAGSLPRTLRLLGHGRFRDPGVCEDAVTSGGLARCSTGPGGHGN